MRLPTKLLCLTAAGQAALTTAQAVYGDSTSSVSSVSTIPASSMSVSISTIVSASISTTTTTPSPMTTPATNSTIHIMPMNCTSACTTVTEPCTESPMPYGTGSWTATPVPPPASGGYSMPASSGTWSFPSQPPASATSEAAAASSSMPAPYEGAAVGGREVGGFMMGVVGLVVGGLGLL